MEYRRLGNSGLRVPALSFGTATFGGGNDFFKAWGSTDAAGAARLIDMCLDHGVSMFDSADVYSGGLAEQVLGEAIKGKRDRLLISTKATFPAGDGPNDYGSSRQHLIDAVDKSLKRLGTDHIDLFQLHGQDYNTPVEETLGTLDQLVRAGKIRYIGGSNFSGWHMMKSLAISDRYGYPRHVAHQAYYSLLNRDYEWELMQLGLDQGVGAVVWSPLGWGKLTGKIAAASLPSRAPEPMTSRAQAHISTRSAFSESSTRSTPSRPRPRKPSRKWRSTGCFSARPLLASSWARVTRRSLRQISARLVGRLRRSKSRR
jgi:aryl-alcohol dehydrogenase-like predicted oxidoreductase